MKHVLIIGASGGIAGKVTALLKDNENIRLTLFLRNRRRLNDGDTKGTIIIEGDALNFDQVNAAVKGQDMVYINLAGDLESMAQNIVNAMIGNGVKKVIFISSIGIYDTPLKPVLKPYRAGADIIENSGLEYTILRPTWFTSVNEVDYETTQKGTPEKGSVISKKSLATLISKIIESPQDYKNQNLGVNKPNS